MNVGFKKHKTFIQLLGAYSLFLLLPIVLITSLLYSQYSLIIKRDTMQNNLERLKKINHTIGISMNDVSRIASSIESKGEMSLYKLSKNAYNIMMAQSMLTSYRTGNSYLVDIVYYSRGSNLLFSSISTYSKQTFMNLVYNSPSIAKDRFWYLAGNSRDAVVLKPEQVVYYKNYVRRMMACIYPIPRSSTNPYSSLIILMDASAIDRVLSDSIDSAAGSVYIVNSNGDVMFSNDSMAHAGLAMRLLDKVDKDSPGLTKAVMLDKEYLVSYQKSQETGWYTIVLEPSATALSQVSTVSGMFFLCMLIILLSSLLFFGFGVKYNYNPMKNLGQLAKKIAGGRETDNEYELIKNAMNNLSGANQELMKKIHSSLAARKEYLLSELLLGKISDSMAFFSEAEELGIRFDSKYFGVALIRFYKNEASVNSLPDKAMKFIGDHLLQNLNGQIKESIDGVSILCIYNVPVKNAQAYVPVFNDLQSSLSRDYGLSTSIGLGGLYDSISGIGKSFMEAGYAMEYRLLLGKNSTILFDSVIVNDDYETDYPKKEIHCLQSSLKEGSTEKSSEALMRLMEVIKTRKMKIHMARFICYDIIYSIINFMREENNEIAGIDQLIPDFYKLMQLSTMEEFTEYVSDINNTICTMIENQTNAIEVKAMAYVKQHFTDPNFSIQAVADHLDVSSGHLSRYFKKKTGQTLIEYIKGVRIEEAKRLLSDTDCPVSNIVKQIGYIDNSSFNRGFKLIVGDTPGNYRAKYRKKQPV